MVCAQQMHCQLQKKIAGEDILVLAGTSRLLLVLHICTVEWIGDQLYNVL